MVRRIANKLLVATWGKVRLVSRALPASQLASQGKFQFSSNSSNYFTGTLSDLNDGSESTLGQSGHYDGAWDATHARPHGGKGVMKWDNGITYSGDWQNGVFHGVGSKMYSRGGGYSGNWVDGKREGDGVRIFGGKFGYDRWRGPFRADQLNGVGVMKYVDGKEGTFEFENDKPLTVAEDEFDGPIPDFDDGSPSTVGIAGYYTGGWSKSKSKSNSADSGIPHGFGIMIWENGIEYKGMWQNGKYHGHGRKLYSFGGGYEGEWANGKRHGHGITFYNEESLGKFGILRWEGPFVRDCAHGVGQAYVAAKFEDEHERWTGDTAVKGPLIEFLGGRPIDFP